MVPDSIERETTIDAPIERVWALLTEPEHLGRWFADAGAEIDLRPGGKLALTWAEHGTNHGIVETVEAPHRFAFRWAPFRDPAGPDVGDGNSTRVEFTLAEQGPATLLRVVETGFASLATSQETRARNVAGNTEGWAHELAELAEHAARVGV